MEEVKINKTEANAKIKEGPVQQLLGEVFRGEGKKGFKYSNGYTQNQDESTTINPNGYELNNRPLS